MDSHSRPVKPKNRPKRARRPAPRPPDPAAETLPVKQERSRVTVDKLLDAAQALLDEGGLERATVPNIARRAGVSVGVVYRRFPDKDALVRAVFERFFGRARAGNAHGTDPKWWDGISLADMAHSIIGSLTAAHRRQRGLLRALSAYKQSQADADFRLRIDELNAESTRAVAELLLARRAEIHHPNPEQAVTLGLFMVAATLRAVIQSEEASLRPFGVVESHLGEELTRMFLGYLGVTGRPSSIRLLHR